MNIEFPQILTFALPPKLERDLEHKFSAEI